MTGEGQPLSDADLLEMAFGSGPDELPGAWEALVDAEPELKARFAAAASRVRLIRSSRAALDTAPACARALLALRRVARTPMRFAVQRAEPVGALLGPDGPPGSDDVEIGLGSSAEEFIVELERGGRVYLRLEGVDVDRVEVTGTDRRGNKSRLALRSDGGATITESWRLEAGEAPVLLTCKSLDGEQVGVGGWVVLVEREPHIAPGADD